MIQAGIPAKQLMWFLMGRRGSDWSIQRRVICEHGIMLKAINPKSLIDNVPVDIICQSVLGPSGKW